MQFVIKGKNLQLTQALKDYAEKKLASIKKYFDHIIEVDVTLSVRDSKDITQSKVCEVTVWAKSIGTPIHGRKASEDLYASIDMVAEKIERQVKKFKEKKTDRRRAKGKDLQGTHTVISFAEALSEKVEAEQDAEVKPRIVRSGTFPMRPMYSDEAAEQLDLFKQEFFVFSNAETNRINVIYRRNDGDFGLIEPEN
jgi:putative sigma-54 modulation protein